MLGSTRAELLKLRERWSIRVLAIIFILIVVLLTYVLTYVIYKNPPPNFQEGLPKGTTTADLIKSLYPPNFHRIAMSSVNGLGAAIAIILGVLAAGSEYGWGTLKTVFTQKPSRATVLTGRFYALVGVTVVLAVILMAAGGGQPCPGADRRASRWLARPAGGRRGHCGALVDPADVDHVRGAAG